MRKGRVRTQNTITERTHTNKKEWCQPDFLFLGQDQLFQTSGVLAAEVVMMTMVVMMIMMMMEV